jgi:hypothetical protein
LVRNPSILTQNHRVTAVSHFDLAFDVSGTRIRLQLEPNHDVFVEGARISYVDQEGNVVRQEPIDRLAHKVYKGTAWIRRADRWDEAGWARVSIRRDGPQPLFEGAFTVYHDHHHVQLAANYKSTRYELDPDIDLRDDEYMVVFRDSDISTSNEHTELRKRDAGMGCPSDELAYNMDLEQNPVYSSMMPPAGDDGWSVNSFARMLKRQLDGQAPGGGNGAGVNLVSTIGNPAGCPSTRKVAMVGVAADCNYRRSFQTENATRDNIFQQMSAASTLFESSFNISLGLANLIVTDQQCPTTVQQATPWNRPCTEANFDIQARLNSFSQWRGQQNDDFSHWTLLSTCPSGSAVGLAWLGQACTAGAQSNGGNNESVAGANIVIRTASEWQVIAHETGHTFGAVHDCTSDLCARADVVNAQQCCPLSSGQCDAGEQFIMNPSTAQGIKAFSPCSIGNVCAALGRNSVKSACLSNNRGVITVTGQTCGNGIVEGDEQCDCGGKEGCAGNTCCDPDTCRLRGEAVCDDSNEDCCRNCQFASPETVCRASVGPCDPEEKCSGTGPYCPEDKTEENGKDCGNGLKCASGQCTSRDQQCRTVMGEFTSTNETYACDDSNCMLSCASPDFKPRGVCYGLQQNFLDGTPCGLAGKCSNGRCTGSNLGNEVKSWIDSHKPLVIGLASAIGSLIVLSILGCCWRSYKRRKQGKAYAATAAYNRTNRANRGAPPPNYPPPRGHRGDRRSSRRAPPPPGPYQGPGNNVPPPPPMYQRSDSVRYA